MDINVELQVRKETPIGDQEACRAIQEFANENYDLDGIYKVQINEIITFLSTGTPSDSPDE